MSHTSQPSSCPVNPQSLLVSTSLSHPSRQAVLVTGLTLAATLLPLSPLGPLQAVHAMSPQPTATLAQATPRPTLKLGSTGTYVEEVQALLSLLGYYNTGVDGQYQASTEAAVGEFQRDVGLTSDGVVGPATWEKLLPTPSTNFDPPAVTQATPDSSQAHSGDAPVELPVLKIGMFGSAVSRVQETLADLGFYQGPIDGVFGPGTEAAVMAFQQTSGLVADGVIGPITWRELLR